MPDDKSTTVLIALEKQISVEHSGVDIDIFVRYGRRKKVHWATRLNRLSTDIYCADNSAGQFLIFLIHYIVI